LIECKFSLDLTKNGIQKTVYAKAGEQNARKLIVTLTHSGCVFVLASQEKTYSAKVFLETGENFEAEVVGNTVQAVIPNAFPEPQIRVCELRVSHGNEVIFSPMFELIIEESLGNKSASESLQSGIAFQESLSNSEIQDEEMLDSDYVVVYDSSKGKATRLPWSKINEKFEGLGNILEGLRKDVDLKASQESVESKAERSEVEKLDASLTSQIRAVNTDLGNRIDSVEDTMSSSFDDVYQRLENNFVPGITPAQAQAIEENTKARHTHENADVLKKLADDNGTLTYNGKAISATGGTTLKSKTYTVGVDGDITTDVTGAGNIEFYIFELLENALLVDIRFTYNGENMGTADFLLNGTINGQDVLEIFPIANNEYGMVARIISNSGNASELANQIQDYQQPITAFTLYYLETNA
jgi:hypothetical protein